MHGLDCVFYAALKSICLEQHRTGLMWWNETTTPIIRILLSDYPMYIIRDVYEMPVASQAENMTHALYAFYTLRHPFICIFLYFNIS